MNDLQIDYFLAVGRNLSFTKTAEEMFISQPAISRQIAAMESELGFVLFDRVNKSIKLTEAGKLFFDFFTQYRQELKNTKLKAKVVNQQREGKIRLACLDGWNVMHFLPQTLANFRRNYPNVEVTLSKYGVRGLINALLSDKVDIILTLDATLNNVENIETKVVTNIKRVILYSVIHPLADKANLTPKDFKDETFFVLSSEEASYANDMVRGYCKPYGFVPKIENVQNIDSMLLNVQSGLGVAVTDVWSKNTDIASFRCVELDSDHAVTLAWNKENINLAINVLVNEMDLILK